ncbi:MAG TPA: polysaccharide biosynthesis/export family protein [Amaricoccus sp.]|uniref:polysaccharide biosynthesis/export family protein n=1 Tax=Amaricoccus sp. TaxID=1872485 RepID=UPI002B62CA07|nr:polysaccharide biosynthesis/export family protein [Amaricoccus sp.]HMQ94790.1 polysaccharide biosynthesis/export family protein [Amaricoccus sp.]HMR53198.1 polysaccharide biosynthesis/export family protein [Amaricoccus sp.]HMR60310.1 polysaccharide biosynthesis/export family protein [Amaricoccus sp.]HMU00131.1 polysaccharide biosynthesis/export family protein [Amaricoccus sp.]
MQSGLRAMAHCAAAVLVAAALAGCTLPRSGPTAGEIKAAARAPVGDMHIVNVTPGIAAAARSSETLAFSEAFVTAAPVSSDTIRPGDALSVTVWENVDAGLLAGVGQKVTALDRIQVDESGQIYVPYAGRLQAAGMTPDALRAEIVAKLEVQTPDPQVEVARVAGDGATVSVMGGVRDPGVYPIETPTRRLSAMLAHAGGVVLVPDIAQIQMERGGRTGRIWLQDLYDNPRLDVALRAGDRIIVEEDRRSFTALGATENQSRVNFNKRDMSALEAIAAAGGLNGNAADPTGIFVFRSEPSSIANRILGRSDLVGEQQVAYVLDLTKPDGLFSARQFIIRNNDTVYVTEAPFAAWSRVLGTGATVVSLAGSVAAIAK